LFAFPGDFSKMAFILAISYSKLMEPIITAGITIILEDSALVFNKRALFSEGEEELLLY